MEEEVGRELEIGVERVVEYVAEKWVEGGVVGEAGEEVVWDSELEGRW